MDEGLAAEDKIMALDKHVTQEVMHLDNCISHTQLDRKVTEKVLEADRQFASFVMGSVSCGTEKFFFGESARGDGRSKVQWIP